MYGLNYWDEDMGTWGQAEEEDHYKPMDAHGNLARLQHKREAHEESLKNFSEREFPIEWKFQTGDYIWKPRGYPFEGTVISAFYTLSGDHRYVVESKLSPGLLHIFNENQLEAV